LAIIDVPGVTIGRQKAKSSSEPKAVDAERNIYGTVSITSNVSRDLRMRLTSD
jgi:hypothetical protein